MRKRIIAPADLTSEFRESERLNIEHLADVEITSEDAAYPIESALLGQSASGWRAGGPGKQTIRLLFAAPQRLRRISLKFVELDVERTQEYVLRWSEEDGRPFREIARQQWNFSPQGATSETEEHRVDLPAVKTLELIIIPDISGGAARASLAQLSLA